MLEEIKNLFKEGLEYTHTAGLLQQIANITNIINAQYMKDAGGKNSAIDLICNLLQSHKDKIVEEVPEASKEGANAPS